MNISGSKVMTRNVRYTFGLCGKSYINHRGNLGVKKWPFLKRKFKLVSGKSSDLHKNWYEWSLGWYLKIFCWDFWNFDFSRFYAYRKGQKWQKWQQQIFRYTPKDHACQFLCKSDHFPETRVNFRFKLSDFFTPKFPLWFI